MKALLSQVRGKASSLQGMIQGYLFSKRQLLSLLYPLSHLCLSVILALIAELGVSACATHFLLKTTTDKTLSSGLFSSEHSKEF